MLQVECISSNNTSSLEVGKVYYAFPLPDGKAAYISRFPNKNAHMGCYQLNRFIETDKPVTDFYKKPSPQSEFEKGKFYVTKMKDLPDRYNSYIDVFAVDNNLLAVYEDRNFAKCIGTMKATLFEKVAEIDPPSTCGKVSLFPAAIKYGWLMDRVGKPEYEPKNEILVEKVVQEQLTETILDKPVQYEQLSLF